MENLTKEKKECILNDERSEKKKKREESSALPFCGEWRALRIG